MQRDVAKIVALNEERRKAETATYDPISGKGAELQRQRVVVADAPLREMWLPRKMMEECAVAKELVDKGSIASVLGSHGMDADAESIEVFWRGFVALRIRYDFEFWAACFVIIKEKGSGRDIPFVLNRGQRKLLKVFLQQLLAGHPVRIILLKARQWGGSTLVQILFVWVQLCLEKQWHSVICAHVENAAKNIRGMYSKLLRNYPAWLHDDIDASLRPFEGSQKTRVLSGRDCKITVGSAERPEGLRSEDIAMAHLSEVGLWPSTPMRKPEDLVQTVISSIPSVAHSVIVYESTAKGVGNFFHREWLRAKSGESGFAPVFVSWFDTGMYTEDLDDAEAFAATMSDAEIALFERGATLQAIAWWRKKNKEYSDHWRFVTEFPSTDVEAFQSTGHRFYPIDDVSRLRRTCRPPKWVGELRGDAEYGRDALSNLRFGEGENGQLRIWDKPDTEELVSDRYVVVVDIGGMSMTSDRSVICVLDRRWMAEGDVPVVAAEWCGHTPPHTLAWKSAQIAKWYHDALLVFESNTYESHKTEGYHGEYVLDEIVGSYSNLFCRTSAELIKQGVPARWGFHTNPSSKWMVCDHQRKVLADGLYIERSIDAADEHDTLEVKPNGEIGAVDGCHDDRHITRAIGLWVCYSYLKPPVYKSADSVSVTRILVNEASI